jgi:hypothetical protein
MLSAMQELRALIGTSAGETNGGPEINGALGHGILEIKQA